MTLMQAHAVIAMSNASTLWFRDADDWYEALALILSERAPA